MPSLPAGWTVRFSQSKGKAYYYHATTKSTQWTRPTEKAMSEDPEPPCKRRKQRGNPSYDSFIRSSMVIGGTQAANAPFVPWNHQLDALQRLVQELQSNNQQRTYLFQHSTGSGKSMTIAALSHQLLYVRQSFSFHTIVIVVDRIKLDQQLSDVVTQYLKRNGVDEVFRTESVEHLVHVLEQSSDQKRVILTTIQKLSQVIQNDVQLTRLMHQNAVNKESHGQVAIIVDEAHRSHKASTREAIEHVMNASTQMVFFGFTATPNSDTLELFGHRENEHLQPFHCYSIAQALDDKRIVNVLQDYQCIRVHVETTVPASIQQKLRKEGQWRQVMEKASDDIAILKHKTLLMMEDFVQIKTTQPWAKCMIVTRSRKHVVQYHRLLQTFLRKRNHAWHCFAAFSGNLAIDGDTVNEKTINADASLNIADIVIVCDKLDTGYNDPCLVRMYIDRFLRSSTHAVQLLSRLNRQRNGKSSVRIVDFVNHPALVRRYFSDFWHRATSSTTTEHAMDLLTAIRILADHPQETDVASLNPDALQQLEEALRLFHRGLKCLEDLSWQLTPEALETVRRIQRLQTVLASIASNPTNSTSQLVQQTLQKMAARVKDHHSLFHGAIAPSWLLDHAHALTTSIQSDRPIDFPHDPFTE